MKKLFSVLFAFLLCCSMAGAQTLTVPKVAVAAATLVIASGSAQSVTHAATATPTTKLTGITESTDINAEWDNNDDFVPSQTGWYRCSGIVDSATPAAYSEARIWVYDTTNNTYIYAGCLAQSTTSNTFSYVFSTMFYGVAGRTYSLYGGVLDGSSAARTITVRELIIAKAIQ